MLKTKNHVKKKVIWKIIIKVIFLNLLRFYSNNDLTELKYKILLAKKIEVL